MIIKKRLNLDEKIYKSNKIIDLVNDYFNLDCRIAKRNREIINPRQIAIYLINKNIFISTKETGKLFLSNTNNYLDHATILHAKNKIKGYLDVRDKEVIRFINDLKDDCKLISKLNGLDLLRYKEKVEILKIIDKYSLEELTNLKTTLNETT